MHIFQRPPFDRTVELLSTFALPTSDLNEQALAHFFGCGKETRPDGVIGLEIHEQDGLLRSLVVAEAARNCGCGKALVTLLERYAKAQNVQRLYLLTMTAERFFTALGYRKIARQDVPTTIRNTTEFTSLCPDSAVVMCKQLR